MDSYSSNIDTNDGTTSDEMIGGKIKYVDVDNKQFSNFINKNYSEYKIKNQTKTMEELCFPKKYTLQMPQLFVSQFMNPDTPYRGILLDHGIGSGKTCAAIRIAEGFKNKKKIIFVLPAALIGNFRSEFRTECTSDYITKKERADLSKYDGQHKRYQEIIKIINNRIDNAYDIYSYVKFINAAREGLKLDNTILIIDEVHNLISETGIYYSELYDLVHKNYAKYKTMRLVILTATPIFDKPKEIALTMNLLLPDDKQLPTGKEFNRRYIGINKDKKKPSYYLENKDEFKNMIRGYISYYRGAPPITYPSSKLNYVKVEMTKEQSTLYKKVIAESKSTKKNSIKNDFFINTRIVSNVYYPNGKLKLKGLESINKIDLKKNLGQFSPKINLIIQKIKLSNGPVFIYSSFKKYGGINDIMLCLEANGYKSFDTNGKGENIFAIWTGDKSQEYKDSVKSIVNSPANKNGSLIKIILASPAAKEGVSFFRMRQVHVLEPYWNFSRMEQIIGRAIRYCSHKDMPKKERHVDVYIYIAVHKSIKRSVDELITEMSINKKNINSLFDKAIKEAAIDCALFKNANYTKGDEKYTCMK
jgi:superfamily II DNA or RNA helicase